MDGYGVPASGPSAPRRIDDVSSESEDEEGIGFPAGGGVAESESDEEDQIQVNGKAPSIGSRCSVKKLHDLISSFDDEKRQYVAEMEFGGLLELPKIARTDRHFLMSILNHIDEKASSITIDHKRDMQFYDEDVNLVIGIPCGTAPVRPPDLAVPEAVVTQIREMFGIAPGEHSILPIVEAVKKIYGRRMTVHEKNKFKVGLVICACTYLLAPTMKNDYFCTDYWGALATVELIHMHNWCRYTREELLVAAKRVKEDLLGGRQKSNLSGCLPFVQVFYIDNLDAGEQNIDHTVRPRVKAYSYAAIRSIIQKDIKSRKGDYPVIYGRLLPRPAADVCYHRNPINRQRAASTSAGRDPRHSLTSNRGSLDIKEASYLVLDKISKFTARCEEVLISTARKKEEENHRHFSALNTLENSAQQKIKEEAKRMRDEFFSFFSTFERRRTIILDPMINNGDRPADELRNEHIKIADELRGALMECIAGYFDGWTPKTKGWQNWFPKLTIGPWVCSRASSGIMALHYARQWMGTKLQRTLSPLGDEIDQSRMILFYEVLGLAGNIGQLPTKFKICQNVC